MSRGTNKHEVLSIYKRFSRIIWLTAIVILILLCWLFWTKVYESPSHVFWGMLNNSLVTSDFTKQTTAKSSTQSLLQITQVKLGKNISADARTTLGQNGSTIQTEEINTLNADYVRYISIKTISSSASKFKDVLNIWGKATGTTAANASQLLVRSMEGIVPIANLSNKARGALLSLMKSKHVYDINYAKVQRKYQSGRLTYIYSVSVDPEAYITLLKVFDKDIGQQVFQNVNPQNYSTAPSEVFTMAVDVSSRNLLQVIYPKASQTEDFSGFDSAQSPTVLPTKTIPLTSLEAMISALK